MLAQRRVPLRRRLGQGGIGDHPGLVAGQLEPERVDAGRLQPPGGPAGQVPPGRPLQAVQQVDQRGVAVRVGREVVPHPGQECLAADVGDQLGHQGGALGVGDHVEVQLDGVEVDDVGGHRVGGGQLVLPVGRGLRAARERGPGQLRVVGLLAHREAGRPRGERLLQPQVVPPPHGHQVAEPHVGQLVQDRVPAVVQRRGRDLAAEQVLVPQGHAAHVLHRAAVVLGHEDLVVLAERVGDPEVLLEHLEPAAGDGQDLLGVQVLDDRLAAVERRRHPLGAHRRTGHPGVVPGDQDGQIGRDGQRLGEPGPAQTWSDVGGLHGQRVAHHRPGLRGDHSEGEPRLEVGLLEAGVHPPGIGGLELGVQIGALIGRVDEAVQALAAAAVAADGGDRSARGARRPAAAAAGRR